MTPTTFKRIRKERLQWSQPRLAKFLRVAVSTVRKWEYGERNCGGPAEVLMELLDEGKI